MLYTKDVEERIFSTKKREKHVLKFLKRCGFFFKEDVYIDDGFELDVWRREKDGTTTALGDLKISCSAFINPRIEPIEPQNKYYLLSHTQYKRYEKIVNETGQEFKLYMLHFYDNDIVKKINEKIDKATKNKNKNLHTKKEISILEISMKRLCKLYNQNLWTIIKLHPKLRDQFVKENSDGKIIKINSDLIGKYTPLNRQWSCLTQQQQQSIKPSGITKTVNF